jgi:hypothetical protein
MALKILAAGFDKDARARIEGVVRDALGSRALSEDWTVSLVKAGARCSVTLDGPEERYRHRSFVADEAHLGRSLAEVLAGGASTEASQNPAAPGQAAGETAAGTRRDDHVCEHCRAPYAVLYETRADDAPQLVSVACPHCWKTNHVEVGAWAAGGREYRAEKA